MGSINSFDKAVRFRNIYLSIAFFSTILALTGIILGIYSEKHYNDLKDKQFATVLKRVNLEKESASKLQGSLGTSKKEIKALTLEIGKLKVLNGKLKKELQETKEKLDLVLLESTPKNLLPPPDNQELPQTSDGINNQ